jgi:hypothetical protein
VKGVEFFLLIVNYSSGTVKAWLRKKMIFISYLLKYFGYISVLKAFGLYLFASIEGFWAGLPLTVLYV